MEESRHLPPAEALHCWEDFIALDEDDLRELVDGRLVEIEVPTGLHERIVARLIRRLDEWADTHGGNVLASGYKVRIRHDSGVMPDVQFFRRGRSIPNLGLYTGVPDLAVEVVSPSSARFDRATKRAWYASIGAPEYWMVDPERRTVERLVLEPGGDYRVAQTARDAATFAPGSFPALAIPLAVLWTLPV